MKRQLFRIELAIYTKQRSYTGCEVVTVMAGTIERAMTLAKDAHPAGEIVKAEVAGAVDIVDDAKEAP